MDEGDSQYASVEGVTVWDGSVEELEEEDGLEGEKRTMVIRGDGRWEVIWRGHVPICKLHTLPVEVQDADLIQHTLELRYQIQCCL